MRSVFLFVFASMVIHINCLAQYSNVEVDLDYEFYQYKTNILKISGVVIGATALAFTFDEPLNKWMQNNQTSFGDGFTDVANVFGEKYVIVPGVGLAWGLGYLIEDDKLKRTSWNAIKSIASTALATELIKISAGRARPFKEEGAFSFHPFSGEDHYKSLPSGHVSLAFAAFTPYAEVYSRWIYVLPGSVAIARIYKNKHWASDTLLGAGLGFLSGWIFTHHPKSNIQVSSNSIIVYF